MPLTAVFPVRKNPDLNGFCVLLGLTRIAGPFMEYLYNGPMKLTFPGGCPQQEGDAGRFIWFV